MNEAGEEFGEFTMRGSIPADEPDPWPDDEDVENFLDTIDQRIEDEGERRSSQRWGQGGTETHPVFSFM